MDKIYVESGYKFERIENVIRISFVKNLIQSYANIKE